ncbi:MAG: hypothetical protein AB1641_05920 [Thermodesulfobacteriota bacterium]
MSTRGISVIAALGLALVITLILAFPVQAQEKGVSVKASTLGLGADFSFRLLPEFGLRLGVNYFPKTKVYDSTISNAKYDVYLNLFTAGMYADYYPVKEHPGFRLTAGLFYNDNHATFEASLNPNQTYTIGGTSYSGAQLGRLKGKVKYNEIAPYLGAGYQFAVSSDRRFSLGFDVGVLYMGRARVTMEAQNPLNLPIQNDLQREESRIKSNANRFEFYPVLSVGATYSF